MFIFAKNLINFNINDKNNKTGFILNIHEYY